MQFFRQRYQSLFRRIGWLAVWALLLPIFVPLFHHPVAALAESSKPMAHCSMMAMTSAPEASKPDTSKSSTNTMPSCPLCQSLHMFSGGFVPPSDAVVSVIRYDQEIFAPQVEAFFAQHWTEPNARPRAPPFFA